MRKSTLFISTVLTIAMMAVLAGVVSAYQRFSAPAQTPVAQQVQPAQALATMPPAQPAVIGPEQAAFIATQLLGDTNVYSVESTEYNGIPAYLVTFSSGKMVYVDPTGEILAVTEVQPVTIVTNNGGNPQTSGGRGGSDDHDEHDDHKDHEDDD